MPDGESAKKLSQTLFVRQWGGIAPEPVSATDADQAEKYPSSFFEMTHGFVQEPRRLTRVYEILPWFLLFCEIAFVVMAGAPFAQPSLAKVGGTPKTMLVVLLILSLLLAAVLSQMTEFALKMLILPGVRRLPGVRGLWRKRRQFFGDRPEVAQLMIDRLVVTRQLEDVVAAGAAVELSERVFVTSSVGALTSAALLAIGGAAPVWYWAPTSYAMLSLLSLASTIPSMNYAIVVLKKSLGEPQPVTHCPSEES
ncbi:MAG TPA: hypothetical protein VK356_06550 [Thermomicrobiales bacterium]|nr:hypothetical protein [Thermomicrobiales bacterium]